MKTHHRSASQPRLRDKTLIHPARTSFQNPASSNSKWYPPNDMKSLSLFNFFNPAKQSRLNISESIEKQKRESAQQSRDLSIKDRISERIEGTNSGVYFMFGSRSGSVREGLDSRLLDKSLSSRILEDDEALAPKLNNIETPKKIHQSDQYVKIITSGYRKIDVMSMSYIKNKSELSVANGENILASERNSIILIEDSPAKDRVKSSALTKRASIRSEKPGSASFRINRYSSLDNDKDAIKEIPMEQGKKILSVGFVASRYLSINKMKYQVKAMPRFVRVYPSIIKERPEEIQKLMDWKIRPEEP